jgi:hypothetical protein
MHTTKYVISLFYQRITLISKIKTEKELLNGGDFKVIQNFCLFGTAANNFLTEFTSTYKYLPLKFIYVIADYRKVVFMALFKIQWLNIYGVREIR